jgi:protocatechuate 3,4-dioxygenase beta subunit
LLTVGGAWAVSTYSGGEEQGSPEEVAFADAEAARRERERVQRPAEEAPAPPVAAPEEPEVQVATEPATRVERLDVHVLQHLPGPEDEPEPVDAGDDEERPQVEIEGVGLVMGGGQQKWAPVPPKGTVTLRGRITDASGKPLADARILRVHLEEDGETVMKMGWAYFTGAGKTGADGRFELTNQPEGSWILQGDWHAWMRREHRLDLDGSRRIDAAPGEVLEGLDFRIPVDPTQLGKVEVYTHDAQGKALRGSSVTLDSWSDWTNTKGLMTIPNREPGHYDCVIHAAGYERVVREVHVRAGETTKIDVELSYALTGTLTLDGRLIDDDGNPVPNVEIFLGTGMDDSRETMTDEDGNFHFEGLPQRMAESPVHVVSMPKWKVELYTQARVETTVPHPGLELVCTKLTNMTVKVRDKENGDPLPLVNAAVRVVEVVDGSEQTRTIRSMSVHREDGNLSLRVPRGRIQMTVEAKDHRGIEIEVFVPNTDGPKEIELQLEAL